MDAVIEIGPGLGGLTAALLARAGRVVAIEIDRGLAQWLRDHTGPDDRLELVEADAREVDLAALSPPARTALVGNLPYYASTPLLRRALPLPFPVCVFMLQREVAARLAAPPGAPGRGAVSVLREAVADVERLFDASAATFYPRPEVESTVVRLRRRPDAFAPDRLLRLEAALAAAFGYRRKGLRQALRHGTRLDAVAVEGMLAGAGLDGHRRPESLTLAEWDALATALAAEGGGSAWLAAAPVGS